MHYLVILNLVFSPADHLNFQIFSRFIYEDWRLNDEERFSALSVQLS